MLDDIKEEPGKKIHIIGQNNRYQINKLKKEDKIICKRKDLCVERKSELNKKISAYKQQDIKKGRYSPDNFVTLEIVDELLLVAENKCFYCLNEVKILYENVREPLQWTLDRIDNEIGHNKNNLVISCLECNLKRRRKSKDAFLFTKQLNIVRENYNNTIYNVEPLE